MHLIFRGALEKMGYCCIIISLMRNNVVVARKRHIIMALLVVVFAVFFQISCNKGGSKDRSSGQLAEKSNDALGHNRTEAEDALVIAVSEDINQLDLLLQNDQINQNCFALTHSVLIAANHDKMEMIPVLAKSWKWLDPTHLELALDGRARFSTGNPVLPDDVVFTLERAMSADPAISIWSSTLANVEKVEVVGKLKVLITLKKVDDDFLYTLSDRSLSIQSRKAYEDPNNKEPWLVGSGRYVFKKWEPGKRVVFERVKRYWGDDPGVAPTMVFIPVPDASERLRMLLDGEVDVCLDLSAEGLKKLKWNNDVDIFQKDGSKLFYMGFNVSRPPFDDINLRRAVSCAIDKNAIVMQALGGLGKWQTSVLNRGNWSFLDNTEIDGYKYDPERAAELIGGSGYSKGVSVVMHVPSSDPFGRVAEMIRSDLKKIGVDVEFKILDEASLKAECKEGKAQCFLTSWNVIGRIDECYRDLFYTGGAANYHHLSDPKVDKLTDEVRSEPDMENRMELSHELQRYHADIVVQVPLYVSDMVVVSRKGLKGALLNGGGQHDWSRAHIETQAR